MFAGFLGRAVAERLHARGAREIVVRRRRDYDLTHEADVARLYRDANPGRYFFANMAMALHLTEQGRLHGIRKFVQAGTICAYPEHTPGPFTGQHLWDGFPEETNAPDGAAKKAAESGAGHGDHDQGPRAPRGPPLRRTITWYRANRGHRASHDPSADGR